MFCVDAVKVAHARIETIQRQFNMFNPQIWGNQKMIRVIIESKIDEQVFQANEIQS